MMRLGIHADYVWDDGVFVYWQCGGEVNRAYNLIYEMSDGNKTLARAIKDENPAAKAEQTNAIKYYKDTHGEE